MPDSAVTTASYVIFQNGLVEPASITLSDGQSQQFTVGGAISSGIQWTITPAGSGTISGTGFYTAPSSIATSETVTICGFSRNRSLNLL